MLKKSYTRHARTLTMPMVLKFNFTYCFPFLERPFFFWANSIFTYCSLEKGILSDTYLIFWLISYVILQLLFCRLKLRAKLRILAKAQIGRRCMKYTVKLKSSRTIAHLWYDLRVFWLSIKCLKSTAILFSLLMLINID